MALGLRVNTSWPEGSGEALLKLCSAEKPIMTWPTVNNGLKESEAGTL